METNFRSAVNNNTSNSFGSSTADKVKLNVVELQAKKIIDIPLPESDVRVTLEGEAQGGPAIKLEVATGALAKDKSVNIEPSILRGTIKLEVEARNKKQELR